MVFKYDFEAAEQYYKENKSNIEPEWYREIVSEFRQKYRLNGNLEREKQRLKSFLERYAFSSADDYARQNKDIVDLEWYRTIAAEYRQKQANEKRISVKQAISNLFVDHRFDEAKRYSQENKEYVDWEWYKKTETECSLKQKREISNQAKKTLRSLLEKYDFSAADNYAQQNKEYVDWEWYNKSKNYYPQKHGLESYLYNETKDVFQRDFLRADEIFRAKLSDSVLSEKDKNILLKKYEKECVSFVKSWIKKETGQEVDDEQSLAVSQVNGHIQVIARAGSGKTRTLVLRALFLHKHCKVSPNEILMLAFNRNAALEMRERYLCYCNPTSESILKQEISHIKKTSKEKDYQEIRKKAIYNCAEMLGIQIPYIMTFHALAYSIVHPEETPLFDDPISKAKTLSRTVQQVIDDHLRDEKYRSQIRELMLAHFREAWENIIKGGYDKNKEEFLTFRRSLPHESLRGRYVKSFGEKVIADFLFEHNVAYEYERNQWWSGINYRPDFTVFKTDNSGVIIEYFGLQGDEDYDEMSQQKRDYWRKKKEWRLLEFVPSDISALGVNGFRAKLKERLEENGIQCVRLSEDEIWQRLRDRAIDRFTEAVRSFIGRCRKLWIKLPDLHVLISRHSCLSPVEGMFLTIAQRIYQTYLDRLSATGEDDFDGLLQQAIELIDKGDTCFVRKTERGNLKTLRYVFVDEYQDFSELFYRMISVVRKQNPHVEFFCVGDDWQAINGFAGSDLKFFKNFKDYFDKFERLNISTNYRSLRVIVGTGNALMKGLGNPARASKSEKGQAWLADLSKFEPNTREKERHPGDTITPAILRLTNDAIKRGLDVVLLNRCNRLPWYVGSNGDIEAFLSRVRSFYSVQNRKKMTISTAHKYKGLEKSMVIVLDAVQRSYPLIHPDWVFTWIFGDSPAKITDEERRLFYVALTRAESELIVITEKKKESPFIDDIRCELSQLKWDDFPPISEQHERVIVQVGNQQYKGSSPTHTIKDFLKAAGYQWQSTGWNSWAKSFPMDEFSIDLLSKEIWSTNADGIEVRIYDEQDSLLERYQINNSQWDKQ